MKNKIKYWIWVVLLLAILLMCVFLTCNGSFVMVNSHVPEELVDVNMGTYVSGMVGTITGSLIAILGAIATDNIISAITEKRESIKRHNKAVNMLMTDFYAMCVSNKQDILKSVTIDNDIVQEFFNASGVLTSLAGDVLTYKERLEYLSDLEISKDKEKYIQLLKDVYSNKLKQTMSLVEESSSIRKKLGRLVYKMGECTKKFEEQFERLCAVNSLGKSINDNGLVGRYLEIQKDAFESSREIIIASADAKTQVLLKQVYAYFDFYNNPLIWDYPKQSIGFLWDVHPHNSIFKSYSSDEFDNFRLDYIHCAFVDGMGIDFSSDLRNDKVIIGQKDFHKRVVGLKSKIDGDEVKMYSKTVEKETYELDSFDVNGIIKSLRWFSYSCGKKVFCCSEEKKENYNKLVDSIRNKLLIQNSEGEFAFREEEVKAFFGEQSYFQSDTPYEIVNELCTEELLKPFKCTINDILEKIIESNLFKSQMIIDLVTIQMMNYACRPFRSARQLSLAVESMVFRAEYGKAIKELFVNNEISEGSVLKEVQQALEKLQE